MSDPGKTDNGPMSDEELLDYPGKEDAPQVVTLEDLLEDNVQLRDLDTDDIYSVEAITNAGADFFGPVTQVRLADDEANRVYTLKFQRGEWRIVGPPKWLEEPKPEPEAPPATPEPEPPDLSFVLKEATEAELLDFVHRELDEHILVAEELLYYLRRLNALHKDAVQNAVDIVQTRRIDFMGETEFDYAAAILMVLFTVVAQASLVGLMGGLLAQGIFKGIARAAARARKTDLRLARLIRQQGKRVQKAATEAARVKQGARNRVRGTQIRKVLSRKKQERLKKLDSILTSRKRRLDDLKAKADDGNWQRQMVRETAVRLNALRKEETIDAIRDATQKAYNVATSIAPKPKVRGSLPIRLDQNMLPYDVELKTMVQSFYDMGLFDMEASLLELKRIRHWLMDSDTDTQIDLLNFLYSTIQSPQEMSRYTQALADLLDTQRLDILSVQYTAEYEFLIWMSLFGGHFKVAYLEYKPEPGRDEFGQPLYPQYWPITRQKYEKLPESRRMRQEQTPDQLNPLKRYLKHRFFKADMSDAALAETIAAYYKAMTESYEEISTAPEMQQQNVDLPEQPVSHSIPKEHNESPPPTATDTDPEAEE